MPTGPKPPNVRREDLLDQAVDHLLAHGMGELSFRKLGDALGLAPNALTYHFGRRQDMIAVIFTRLAERTRIPLAGDPRSTGVPARTAALWERLTRSEYARVWPAFFECLAVALRDPDRHRSFLDHVARDWVVPLAKDPAAAAMNPEQAETRAALTVAAVRGLMIDHLAGADPDRTAGALRELAATIESWLEPTG